MTSIADVIIIGSGALGCATAFALSEGGIRRVTVVDRGPLISGMTRRNAGLVHTYQPDTASMQFAREGIETYRHWATLIGGACGYAETGTVVIAQDEEQSHRVAERASSQQKLGIEAQLLNRSQLSDAFPLVSFQDVRQGAFEPGSGYVDSVLASQGFARRARENGTRFETGALVRQIGQDRARVTHVITTTGTIQAPVVIIAAGAGAERLLMPLGVILNLQPSRGAIGFFEQPPSLHEDGHPIIVDALDSTFIRPHAFHLTAVGIADKTGAARNPETPDDVVTAAETASLAALAARRVPLLTDAPLKRAHTIAYDRLADGLPALARVPGFEGLYLLAGFGGSSVAVAPGAGRAMAALVVDGKSSPDVGALSLTRPSLAKSRLHAD